ncbi:MAG: phage holin family protein [Steroidobacteraceae bacterium]
MREPAPPAGEKSAARQTPPLQGLLAAALDALRTRLDLASVELEIHLLGIVRVLAWAVAAIVCGLLALAFGVTALIAALWDTHRLLGLLAGSLTFGALAVIFGIIGARTLHSRPGILAGSLQQLADDHERVDAPP